MTILASAKSNQPSTMVARIEPNGTRVEWIERNAADCVLRTMRGEA